jgi:hypothetical protein
VTYTISINGHKDGLTGDEAKEFEQAQADAAKRLVSELDGVTSASFSGGNVGGINLKDAE